MTIFRGPGGGGNANTDAEINALTAISLTATAAALASSNAATAAAGSAVTASTQATNASNSASAASGSAATASTQATNASNSASAASSSASGASTSASNAASSAASVVKDGSGGVAGLTLFKINMRNVLNTFTSFLTNSNTAARTYTLPDKDGTVSMISDLTAATVTNTPAGTITTATVQAALNELDTKKAAVGANTTITSLAGLTSINGGQLSGLRNRIINGNPLINQRSVSGTVTLAAGIYGHDRFKAGASGCTYTFATAANVTTITISAGSLQQVIEGLNLETGTYAFSWTGTAQGKIAAGSFAASGVTAAVTGGTNTTIEFGTGSFTKAQFEINTVSVFEQRPFGLELALCLRYFRTAPRLFGLAVSATNMQLTVVFGNPMRVTPTVVTTNAGVSGESPVSVTGRTASGGAASLGFFDSFGGSVIMSGFSGMTGQATAVCNPFCAFSAEL